MKKIQDERTFSPEEEAEIQARLAEKNKKRRKTRRFWDRVAGFIIMTCIVGGVAALSLEYILVKGPSPALKEAFVNTMFETRRFKFIPNIFLSEAEVDSITSAAKISDDVSTDTSMIVVDAQNEMNETGMDAYGLVDEDGDGVILCDVKGSGYVGYMLVILDPGRVFVGMPDDYGGVGMTLNDMVAKYDAKGGINAGGFKDDGGGGMGGVPQGLTIVDGYCYNTEADSTNGFAGFDDKGILHVGFYTYDDCVASNIVNGVSFGPILISNGVQMDPEYLNSAVNPRTAIGQRADGAVLMLVIDGRQVHSMGATYQDVVDVMLDYGAVNACNMDGGSSTIMYLDGKVINSCSSASGTSRLLPTAFLFR